MPYSSDTGFLILYALTYQIAVMLLDAAVPAHFCTVVV
jgi:hypothetical protein